MRKLILIAALVLVSATAQAGTKRGLTVASNEATATEATTAAETPKYAARPAAPERSGPNRPNASADRFWRAWSLRCIATASIGKAKGMLLCAAAPHRALSRPVDFASSARGSNRPRCGNPARAASRTKPRLGRSRLSALRMPYFADRQSWKGPRCQNLCLLLRYSLRACLLL